MSKKKKEKSKKSGKKHPDKKTLKKASKPSPNPKKNAAKTSKPKNAKKAKPAVNKSASGNLKTAKSAAKGKKVELKAAKSKTPVKVPAKSAFKNSKSKASSAANSKNTLKKATVAAGAKKAEPKASKKPQTPAGKVSKPIPGPARKAAMNPPSKNSGPVKKAAPAPVAKTNVKKEAVKPVLPAASLAKKEMPASAVKKQDLPVLKKADEAPTKKQVAEKKANDVLAITNTIPVKATYELPLSKIASISSSITNPIRKTDSYAVKPEKEPNGKFELEFVVHSSAEMLYEFLSTPSGLSEWFCDDLNIRNGIYTFIWDDQLQQARLLKTVDLQVVRFQWVDKTDGSYFEFRIQRDDLTNDISLIITDFAETVGERESSKLLWHSQIEKLMHVIGSIF